MSCRGLDCDLVRITMVGLPEKCCNFCHQIRQAGYPDRDDYVMVRLQDGVLRRVCCILQGVIAQRWPGSVVLCDKDGNIVGEHLREDEAPASERRPSVHSIAANDGYRLRGIG
jgi:hypothetical protein